MSEAHSLDSLAMAAVSICVGVVCAIRFKVMPIVVMSIMSLVAAALATLLSWDVAGRIVIMMILMQAAYVVSAVIQSFLHKQ